MVKVRIRHQLQLRGLPVLVNIVQLIVEDFLGCRSYRHDLKEIDYHLQLRTPRSRDGLNAT